MDTSNLLFLAIVVAIAFIGILVVIVARRNGVGLVFWGVLIVIMVVASLLFLWFLIGYFTSDDPSQSNQSSQTMEPQEPAPTIEPAESPETSTSPLDGEPLFPGSAETMERRQETTCIVGPARIRNPLSPFVDQKFAIYDIGDKDCPDVLDMEGWGDTHTNLPEDQATYLGNIYDDDLVDQTVRGRQSLVIPIIPGEALKLIVWAGWGSQNDRWNLETDQCNIETQAPDEADRGRTPIPYNFIIPADCLGHDDWLTLTFVNISDDEGKAGIWGIGTRQDPPSDQSITRAHSAFTPPTAEYTITRRRLRLRVNLFSILFSKQTN